MEANQELGLVLETSCEALKRLQESHLKSKSKAIEDIGESLRALADAGAIINSLKNEGVNLEALFQEHGISIDVNGAVKAISKWDQLDLWSYCKEVGILPPKISSATPQQRPPSAICLQSFKRISEALKVTGNVPEWFSNLSQPQKDALKQSIEPAKELIALLS